MYTCGGRSVARIPDDTIGHCFAKVEKKRNLHSVATTAITTVNIENTFLFYSWKPNGLNSRYGFLTTSIRAGQHTYTGTSVLNFDRPKIRAGNNNQLAGPHLEIWHFRVTGADLQFF